MSTFPGYGGSLSGTRTIKNVVITTDYVRDLDANKVTIGGSGNPDFLYGGDLGATINAAIAKHGQGKLYEIYAGTYISSTTINFKGNSRMILKGAGERLTIIYFTAGTSAVDMDEGDGGTETFENVIMDMSLFHGASPGAATGNSNTVGIKVGRQKTIRIENVFLRYWETGIQLRNEVFYANIYRANIQNSTTGIHITYGADDRCNSNTFYKCKVLDNVSYALRITRGNCNTFNSCDFENWGAYAVYFDGNLSESNQIFGGRMESNSQTPTGYIYFGSGSKNNTLNNPYLSGDDWISESSSISIASAASGNSYYLNSYLGEVERKERAIATAGNFIKYIRGSAGTTSDALLTLEDSYEASGEPNTLLITNKRTNRSEGKFITCSDGTDEYAYIDNNGIMGSNKGFVSGVNQTDQDTYLKLLSSTAGSDYDARLIRYSGTNGNLELRQVGAGEIRLNNGSNTYVKLGQSGRFGIRSANAAAAGSKFHISDTSAPLDIIYEREDAVNNDDILINKYFRNNSVNLGYISLIRKNTTVNSNASMQLQLYTRDDTAAGGALDQKFILDWTGSAQLDGDFLPMTNDAHDLGSSAKVWQNGYFGNGIHLQETGGGTDVVTLSAAASSTAYTIRLPDDAATANDVMRSDGSGNLSWLNVASGSNISPTITNGTNISGCVYNYMFYTRIGTIVDVTISLYVTTSASGLWDLTLTIPVDRSANFSGTYEALGSGAMEGNGYVYVGSINGTKTISVSGNAAAGAAYNTNIHYKYTL